MEPYRERAESVMTNPAPVYSNALKTIDLGHAPTHVLSKDCWCNPYLRASGPDVVFFIGEFGHRAEIKVGDRVAAVDPALADLNEGIVGAVRTDDGETSYLINFVDHRPATVWSASETRRIS